MPSPIDLQDLHDIIVPGPAPWLPPAPGWYALGLTVALLMIWGAVALARHRRCDAYRREALAELARLQSGLAGEQPAHLLLPRIPELLKRTALAAYGREAAASLSGQPWLDFLDARLGRPVFAGDNGRLLLLCSYGPETLLHGVSRAQAQGLCGAVRAWLAGHRAGDGPEPTVAATAGSA
ncbi:DUF4381 domain-containing protein [Fundidesulfovibrio agrisoli]|uniref:DUF4381 domain-containing protein n=1 Tax=Fundidesulfovibrio agrisoli TaxID=2922717 RepID=UPI001FAB7EF0|nr:DUF4381 domain-containing protein [Fundidesulfovibrio agrisoli]